MNIYAGNLGSDVTEDDLTSVFKAFGEITNVNLVKDKFNNESRGFGFVEMPSKDEAQSAIKGLNGSELNGQMIQVSEARPRRKSHPDS